MEKSVWFTFNEQGVLVPKSCDGPELTNTIFLDQNYSATSQETTEDDVIFLLDQVLPGMKKHDQCESYLNEVFKTTDIFEPLKHLMTPFEDGSYLRLPYIDEMFKPDDFGIQFDNTLWPLIKISKNIIGRDIDGNTRRIKYWIQNRLEDGSSVFGAVSSNNKDISFDIIDWECYYIRPVFKLRTDI